MFVDIKYTISLSVAHDNTGTVIQCTTWHQIFSKTNISVAALTPRNREDVCYTCGASLEDLALPDSLAAVEIRDYATMQDWKTICIHCAATTDLVAISGSLYPTCTLSHQTKQPVSKRRSIQWLRGFWYLSYCHFITFSCILCHLSFEKK